MDTNPVKRLPNNKWKILGGFFLVSCLGCIALFFIWGALNSPSENAPCKPNTSESGCEEILPLGDTSLLRLSKNGNILAVYHGLEKFQTYDTNTKVVKELTYEGEMVGTANFDIALTSDGNYAAVIGSTTGQPSLGLVDTRQPKLTLNIIPMAKGEFARRVVFSPDDKVLAALIDAENDYVAFYQVPDGEKIGKLDLPGETFSIAYSPDGHLTTASGGSVLIWDVTTKTVVSKMGGNLANVSALVYSPDGSLLAVSSGERSNSGGMGMDLFQVDNGTILHHFSTKNQSNIEYPFPVAFSTDGKLVSASSCDEANVYRVSDGGLVTTFIRRWDTNTFAYADCLSVVQFTPDGKSVYYGWDAGGAVVKWKLP